MGRDRISRKWIAFAALAGIVAGATGAYAASDNAANFEMRRENMRANGRALFGQINRVVRGQLEYSPATVAAAEELVTHLAVYSTLFEPGSDVQGSKIKPEALAPANRAEIERMIANVQAAAAELLPVVRTGDKDKIAVAIKPAIGACSACHDKYANLKD